MDIKQEIGLWLWFIFLFGWFDVLVASKEDGEGTGLPVSLEPTDGVDLQKPQY